MNTRDKFRIAYSTTRQAIREARGHKKGKMAIAWISVPFSVEVEAQVTNFGDGIAVKSSDPDIADAVTRTMLVRYGYA